jgi:iron complex outermembrane receptor protein
MLKRVEVLTGGASSVYGADAVAGVVNFILDTDFTGFRIDANYGFFNHNNRDKFLPPFIEARGFPHPKGNTADGANFDATVGFGADFADDKGHFMAYGGYRKIKPVIQGKRDYSACTLQNGGT